MLHGCFYIYIYIYIYWCINPLNHKWVSCRTIQNMLWSITYDYSYSQIVGYFMECNYLFMDWLIYNVVQIMACYRSCKVCWNIVAYCQSWFYKILCKYKPNRALPLCICFDNGWGIICIIFFTLQRLNYTLTSDIAGNHDIHHVKYDCTYSFASVHVLQDVLFQIRNAFKLSMLIIH